MLIGHEKQWKYLSQLMSIGNLSHGYVFCGSEKIGKRTLAVELAKKIYGDDLLSRINGNFKIIIPDGKEIKIGQVRELISWLSLMSIDGKIKLAIIDDAHCLNEEAQNCLLKTLEEPKGETVIILITAFPKALLKTILSRLSVIKFYSLKEEVIINGLVKGGVSKSNAERAGRLAMGKFGTAKDLLEYPSRLEKQEKELNLLDEMLKSPLSRRMIMIKELGEDYKNITEMLAMWVWELRKRFIANNQSVEKLKIRKIIARLEYTKALIDRTNINSTLTMEALMIEI
ncbi:MAG: hypothetical protein V1905_00970 [bacterium]